MSRGAQTSERVNTAMKKLLALGLLSVAALGFATAPASAWWPCFPLKGCCKNKCCSTICIRQYNAFTPVCCGSLCCDGCCPMTFGGCNFGGGNNCCMPNQSCCVGGDAACLGQLPAPGAVASPMMPPATAQQQAPLPNAMSYAGAMPWNPYAGYNPYAMSNVQPAAYQPSMYPGYMPMNPYAGQVPYYWGGNGR